jgi:hypothetical protein
MHEAVADYCAKWATDEPGTGLDVGGRDLNGHPRGLWPQVVWDVLDLYPGPGVTIVADARTWIPEHNYDVVICTEVLEHVEDWQPIVVTAASALVKGGRLVVTCAGPGRFPHSGLEATEIQPGEHYCNVAPVELGYVMRRIGLTVDDLRLTGLDTQAAAIRVA